MNIAIRIAVGLLGLFGVFMTVLFWLSTNSAAGSMGLMAVNASGLAAIRADIAAFFGVVGVFSLLTAWRGDGQYALGPMALMGFALFGRIVSSVLGDFDPAIVPGMVIEAVSIGILALAWRSLKPTAA